MFYTFTDLFSKYKFQEDDKVILNNQLKHNTKSLRRLWFDSLLPFNIHIFQRKKTGWEKSKEGDEDDDDNGEHRRRRKSLFFKKSTTQAAIFFIFFTVLINHPSVKQPLINFIYSYTYPASQYIRQLLSYQDSNSIDTGSNSRLSEKKKQILSWIKNKRSQIQPELGNNPPTTFIGLLPPLLAVQIQKNMKKRKRYISRMWKHLSIEIDFWKHQFADNFLSKFSSNGDRNKKSIQEGRKIISSLNKA